MPPSSPEHPLNDPRQAELLDAIRAPQEGPSPAAPGSDGSGQDAEAEQEFRRLADLWRKETGMSSSLSKKLQHPAYRQIIGMGHKALPWILRDLQDHPGAWFEALRTIAKQSPVPPEDRADPKKARAAWLKWGKERGFIK